MSLTIDAEGFKELVKECMPAAAVIMAAGSMFNVFDKQGVPTLYHAMRVGLSGKTDDERTLGFLHDLVEDNMEEFRKAGEQIGRDWDIAFDALEQDFSIEIIRALRAITRKPDESYKDYILRLAENDLATRVKLHDLDDNMDLSRGPIEQSLLDRYTWAKSHLMKVQQEKRKG